MARKLIILCAIVIFTLVSVSMVLAAGDPGVGKTVYEKNCMACHGKEGKGDGPAGKVLKPAPSSFHDPEKMKKTDDELTASIKNGVKGTTMAPFAGKLDDKQIADVLAYIRTFGSR